MLKQRQKYEFWGKGARGARAGVIYYNPIFPPSSEGEDRPRKRCGTDNYGYYIRIWGRLAVLELTPWHLEYLYTKTYAGPKKNSAWRWICFVVFSTVPWSPR